MKKLITYLTASIVGLAFLCCSDDKPDQGSPFEQTTIITETKSLDFKWYGGEQRISVATENQGQWKARSNISWIQLSEPEYATGELVVKVGVNEEIEILHGAIILTAEGAQDVKIPVTLQGQGHMSERTTLQRLNVKGDVEHMDKTVLIHTAWEKSPWIIENMSFNGKGMITYYEFSYNFGEVFAPIIYDFNTTVEYDTYGRISKIDCTSDAVLTTGGFLAYTLEFQYSDHGKYIDASRFYRYMEKMLAIGRYDIWAPRMIKNLEKISIYNTALTPNTWDVEFLFEGDYGEAVEVYHYSGEDYVELLFTYNYDGHYPKTWNYEAFFLEKDIEVQQYLKVDSQSGHVYVAEHTTAQLGDEIVYKTIQLPRRHNPPTYFKDALDVGYEMYIDYNDNCDVVYVEDIFNGFFSGFEYEFDEMGNWTTVKGVESSTHLSGFNWERNITYRK